MSTATGQAGTTSRPDSTQKVKTPSKPDSSVDTEQQKSASLPDSTSNLQKAKNMPLPDSTTDTKNTEKKHTSSNSDQGDDSPDYLEYEEENTDSEHLSVHSSSSVLNSDILAKKRAELGKAKARMLYAAKEMTLRKQQMELEAELEMINLKREAAEAETMS